MDRRKGKNCKKGSSCNSGEVRTFSVIMSKIVLKSLSVLLGAFFIFLGALKVTPRISKDLHKDLRTEYAKYAKVKK